MPEYFISTSVITIVHIVNTRVKLAHQCSFLGLFLLAHIFVCLVFVLGVKCMYTADHAAYHHHDTSNCLCKPSFTGVILYTHYSNLSFSKLSHANAAL